VPVEQRVRKDVDNVMKGVGDSPARAGKGKGKERERDKRKD
jgi:hypothetical protein